MSERYFYLRIIIIISINARIIDRKCTDNSERVGKYTVLLKQTKTVGCRRRRIKRNRIGRVFCGCTNDFMKITEIPSRRHTYLIIEERLLYGKYE